MNSNVFLEVQNVLSSKLHVYNKCFDMFMFSAKKLLRHFPL